MQALHPSTRPSVRTVFKFTLQAMPHSIQLQLRALNTTGKQTWPHLSHRPVSTNLEYAYDSHVCTDTGTGTY